MSDLDWKWNDYFRGTGFAGPTVLRILHGATSPQARRGAGPLHRPPHRGLLHLHLAALHDHGGGGAHGILQELHRVFYQCFLKLFNSKELLGNPKQFKKHINCTYTRYFEWSVVSFHNLQCNVISKKSYSLPKISVWCAPPLGSYLEYLWRNTGSRL